MTRKKQLPKGFADEISAELGITKSQFKNKYFAGKDLDLLDAIKTKLENYQERKKKINKKLEDLLSA